jgi:hypothetical protein
VLEASEGKPLCIFGLVGSIVRAFRHNRLFEAHVKMREQVFAVESERLSKVESLKTDPLEFFRQVLGVEPTDYQKGLIELLYKNQFTAARWSRQTGKASRRWGCFLIMR